MGLERLFRGLYGTRPQIDIVKQIARVRVPEPMTFDFVELEAGIKRNNIDTAAIILHAEVDISGGQVRLSTGQRFSLKGSAPSESKGRLRMSVHDWKDPKKIAVRILD